MLTPELDVGFHAVPAVMLLIDLLILSPPWTITVAPTLAISGTIAFAYWFWVELCYQHNGWCVSEAPPADLLGAVANICLGIHIRYSTS